MPETIFKKPLSRTTWIPLSVRSHWSQKLRNCKKCAVEVCLNHIWGCIIIITRKWRKLLIIIRWWHHCIFNVLRELQPPHPSSRWKRRTVLRRILKCRPVPTQEFSSRNSLSHAALWEAFSQTQRVPLCRSHTDKLLRHAVVGTTSPPRLSSNTDSWHYCQLAYSSFCECDTRHWEG
jgi:hypothetical protein